jgi:perosamine synthetase
MANLAICGGDPVRSEPYPVFDSIGEEEKQAVLRALDGPNLSGFLGRKGDFFLGGPIVRDLERRWKEYFGVKHALSLNSATAGLYAAMGATGVGPGDEVIVSPYTMSASATCALVYNAVPVFADIDPVSFNINAETIAKVITEHTKAIVVVDILGHPSEMDDIMELASKHGLLVVEDAAQAYGASYRGRPCGTLADIGVFSLNRHKTIQCGEGGMVVTEDDELAQRVALIRNHGEVILRDYDRAGDTVNTLVDMLGFNYRMTELEAAIAIEQLKKLPALLDKRLAAAQYLTEELKDLPGITPPGVLPDCEHGYYLYAMKYDPEQVGVSRKIFVEAINREGIPLVEGYGEPLYMQPIYRERTLYGNNGCPFTCPHYKGELNYEMGTCPVCERMFFEEVIFTNVCHSSAGEEDLQDVVTAFKKVLSNIDELKQL